MPSLIAAPPNILGIAVPHPGLLPTSINNLLVNGVKGWAEDIGDALTNLTISFDIDGTSTVIAQVEDPQRSLLRSPLGLQRSVINIDGISFVLAQINKQGPQITLTFEHVVCSALKDHTEIVSVQAQTLSRTAFCEKLVGYEGWINCSLPGGESPGGAVVVLSNGSVDSTTGGAIPLPYSTTFTELETFWDSTGTILATIGWRRFPLGVNTLVIVSDEWLYTQPPIAVIDEQTLGIQSIDFDWDIRKPLGTLTIICNASAWAFPIGSVIEFTPKMGIAGVQSDLTLRFSPNASLPPANGHWLVTDISRSLMSSLATITLDVPNLTMTEPQTQPPTTAAAQVAMETGATTTAITGGMSAGAFADGLLEAIQAAGHAAPITANNVANIERLIQGESAGNTGGFLRDINPFNLNTYASSHGSLSGGHIVNEFGIYVQVFDSLADCYAAYVSQLEVTTGPGACIALLAALGSSATAYDFGVALSTSAWSSAGYANGPTFEALTPFTGSALVGGVAPPAPPNPGTLQTGKNATPLVAAFVKYCLDHTTAASGCTYVWGAAGPTTFDCSGLAMAAMKSIGVNVPYHNSDQQYAWAAAAGYAISPATAIKTYGAILICSAGHAGDASGHEGVSLGNGTYVNANCVQVGIVIQPIPAGFFDKGFLIPGIKY
jgi:peptidoglycan DL-endopeptidase CwlO